MKGAIESGSGAFALRALRGVGALLQRLPRGAAWIPPSLWIALIWFLSSQPSSNQPRPAWLGFIGNLAHAPLFGLLALWLALLAPREGGWPRLRRAAVVAILAGVLLYAVTDELHQSTVAGRDASPFDIATDAVGAACTLWIVHYVGTGEAGEGGLWKRLALGIAVCSIAAYLAQTV